MGLEMKIFKEIAAYEPKPMFGATWRQIAALAFMVIVGGGLFAGVTFGLMGIGKTLEESTNVAMYLMFPVLIPAAAWGWWRPMGLKPERYLGFFLRHNLTRKTIRHEDTFQPQPGADAAESVHLPSGESAQQPPRERNAKQLRAVTRKLRKTVTEHAQPQAARGRTAQAGRAPQRPRP